MLNAMLFVGKQRNSGECTLRNKFVRANILASNQPIWISIDMDIMEIVRSILHKYLMDISIAESFGVARTYLSVTILMCCRNELRLTFTRNAHAHR